MQWRAHIYSPVFMEKPWVMLRLFSLMALLALIVGCRAVPSAGPRPESFSSSATWERVTVDGEDGSSADLPFVLVDVDRKVIESLDTVGDPSFIKGALADRNPPSNVPLGVGDTIRITIFEAGPGGLFVPQNGTGTGGNYVTLPDQEVDQTGYISVPYAEKDHDGGRVKVSDRRPADVQNDIQERLINRAIEPQVIVSLVKRTSNSYSVIGDVNTPGRYGLTQDGVRILDALSTAGGPKSSDYNTLITVQRGTNSATARMSMLLADSENNIFVQPGDLIAVKKDERFYNVLGATKNNNRVPFEAEKVTVADALAKAGGLNSDMAEPASVVVFRRENPETLKAMGVSLEGKEEAADKEPMPTVYRFDLTEPKGMFLAQKMQLRNDDVVYVSSHPFSDVSKLFSVLRDVLLIRLINQ